MPILNVCISGHGFGHLSQISSVIRVLVAGTSGVRLLIRSPLPRSAIEPWLGVDFIHVQVEDDIGMRMHDALEVDLAASEQAYSDLHSDWEQKVSELARQFREEHVSLVLADVPYLPLAAAQLAGIPSIALCSLNWADIVERYFPERQDWIQLIRTIYQGADAFLVPEPGMAMPWLANQQRIGPVGRQGVCRRKQLNQLMTDLTPDTWLVLVGMGGVHHPLALTRWPATVGGQSIHYLVPPALAGQVANATSTSVLPFGYADLIASSDLVVTKPGYGMFVEAAGAGIPVLYARREGWPDVPSLTQWLERAGHSLVVDPFNLEQGRLAGAMEELLTAGRYAPVQLSGGAEAAEIIKGFIS